MSKAAYINDEGKLVVDVAEADKLWKSLNMEQQYQAMCAMFDPLLKRATEMQAALQKIAECAPDEATAKIASDAFRDATG